MKHGIQALLLLLLALPLLLSTPAFAHSQEQDAASSTNLVQTRPSKDAAGLVQQKCTDCHNTTRICLHLNIFDKQGWERTVSRMVEHGAKLDKTQQTAVIGYLSGPPRDFPDCAPQEGVAELGAFATVLMMGHPVLMFLNICLAVGVLFLGVQRFRSSTLGQRVRFPWKTHVRLGYVVMTVFLLGLAAGPTMTSIFWGEFGTSGTHFQNGLLMLPLILIGLGSGWYMDSRKAQRRILPLVHGINNLLLVLLALCQLTTGAQMVMALLG